MLSLYQKNAHRATFDKRDHIVYKEYMKIIRQNEVPKEDLSSKPIFFGGEIAHPAPARDPCVYFGNLEMVEGIITPLSESKVAFAPSLKSFFALPKA